MKTAEEVLREHTKGIYAFEHPTLPETLQDLRGAIIKAMELYASEQNAKLYPIKMLAWEITPETDPNALKSGSKFKAVCDGEVKSGESVNELMAEIYDETADYFYKAIDGFKKENAQLRKENEELKKPLGNSAHPLEDRLIQQAKEESKNWKDPNCFIGGFGWGCGAASRLSEEKITRLTELLRKAMPRLYSWPYLQDEIENAIGHEKPN